MLDKGDMIEIEHDNTTKEAAFIGYADQDGYVLLNKNGIPVDETHDRPIDYKEWDPETEEFPGEKVAVRTKDPVFETKDGEEIKGSECVWSGANAKIEQKISQSPTIEAILDASGVNSIEELAQKVKNTDKQTS